MKIAITGKMCSGKSTLAQIIKETDSRFTIYSFGQKVKDVAKDLFNMKEKDRSLLTSIGTKMREIDYDVWVNYVINQTKDKTHCIVDDLRYQNEYEALHNNGYKIIQLVVDPAIQEERIKNVYPNNYQDHLNNRNHISERNKFNWLSEDNLLVLNSDEDKIVEIREKVLSFIKE
jgi:adenylate kinase family enzyme